MTVGARCRRSIGTFRGLLRLEACCHCVSTTRDTTTTTMMLDTHLVSPPSMIDKPQSTERQILKVFYKDNTFKSYNLPVDVQAMDVCAKFATKFLRISERAASHFSLHLVIQGKVVKQLKPTDAPIKIQAELSTLGYKFNTNENENYFLFCLSEETKSKMNDYCERNSVMLGSRVVDQKKDNQSQVSETSPQRGTIVRTQSMLTFLKPTKERFSLSAFKKKQKTTPKKEDATPKKDERRQRRETAPPQISPILQLHSTSQSFTPQPSTSQPSTPQSISHPSTPQYSTPQPSTSQPYPVTPGATSKPSESSSRDELVSPERITSPLSHSWSPDSPVRGQTFGSPLVSHAIMPLPPSPKLFSPPSSPYCGLKTAEEDLETVISAIFSNNNSKDTDVEDVGQMMDDLFDWYPTNSSAPPQLAGSPGSAAQSPSPSPSHPAGSPATSRSAGSPAPRSLKNSRGLLRGSQAPLNGDDDFNEILDALRQLSSA